MLSVVESIFDILGVLRLPLLLFSGDHLLLNWWLVCAVGVQKVLSSILIAGTNIKK
jgi:hypothetical protein